MLTLIFGCRLENILKEASKKVPVWVNYILNEYP